MSAPHNFFATAAKGLEPLVVRELEAVGAGDVKETRAGVSFSGTLEIAYRFCLWSRVASRVLMPVATIEAPTAEALYQGVFDMKWLDHLSPTGTLAVDATAVDAAIGHSHFAALKVKDAVVDKLRTASGTRPNVDKSAPDVRINLHLRRSEATISIDLSGNSLHRRGYRSEAGEAPLRETLAAAILMRASWPETAAAGRPCIDPMCGAGTFPIEAALMATDTAPGLERQHWGFSRWAGHDPHAWKRLTDEATSRRYAGRKSPPRIIGYDADARVVTMALANVERAGLRGIVHIERREISECKPPSGPTAGILVVNPPYGERLGTVQQLTPVYAALGARFKEAFGGWTAFVLTSDDLLAKSLGLSAAKRHRLFNGNIACQLLHLPIRQQGAATERARAKSDAGREMISNRLRKNIKRLKKWTVREKVSCYRVYDADIPEYAAAVDRYEDAVVVQEYEAPSSVAPGKAAARLQDLLAVVPEVMQVEPEAVFLKIRRRQKGKAQYGRLTSRSVIRRVQEGGLRFEINLSDYLDTGLFLDHRPTRALIREHAKGRRFLNLFGYTGTATVYAVDGGAIGTTTVDMSNTYLAWARRNLELNGFTGRDHEIVHADCLEWLARSRRHYGLIFLDPPTFSTSKSMRNTFDVQRDYADLIAATVRLLTPDGILIFSTNARRFRLDAAALEGVNVKEISAATIPKDFEHDKRVHRCWMITRQG